MACAAGITLAGMGPGGPGRGPRGGPGGGPDGMLGGGPLLGRLTHDPDLQKALALSADQIDRLTKIATAARVALVKQRAEVEAQRIELHSLVADSAATRASIEQQSARVGKAMDQLHAMMTTALLDARDVLSADQRERLKSELQQRAGQLRQERRQMRQGRRGPPPDEAPGEGPEDEDDGDE